jgi:hypothetical protein
VKTDRRESRGQTLDARPREQPTDPEHAAQPHERGLGEHGGEEQVALPGLPQLTGPASQLGRALAHVATRAPSEVVPLDGSARCPSIDEGEREADGEEGAHYRQPGSRLGDTIERALVDGEGGEATPRGSREVEGEHCRKHRNTQGVGDRSWCASFEIRERDAHRASERSDRHVRQGPRPRYDQ